MNKQAAAQARAAAHGKQAPAPTKAQQRAQAALAEARAKRHAEEAEQGRANAAKLAKAKIKTPQVDALPGMTPLGVKPRAYKKGEVIQGVTAAADGAADQPHTKQALRDNAKGETRDGQVKARDPNGKMVWVPETDPRLYLAGTAWILFVSKAARDVFAKGEAALAAQRARQALQPKSAAVPAKAKQKPPVRTAQGGDQKITVVAKTNPYKAGTKAAATFDLFAKSPTVADFRALVAKAPANYDAGYVRYSSRDGYIKLG